MLLCKIVHHYFNIMISAVLSSKLNDQFKKLLVRRMQQLQPENTEELLNFLELSTNSDVSCTGKHTPGVAGPVMYAGQHNEPHVRRTR